MVYWFFVLWLAVAPGVVLLVRAFVLDKVEREPWKLIGKIVLWGIISTIIAVILELAIEPMLLSIMDEGTVLYVFWENFVGVALIEELCKYFAAKIPTWKNREFDYKYDAIVYTVASAVGFAVFENIFYCIDGGISIAIFRAIVSVPGHVIFGVFMGYFYGCAKYCDAHGNVGGRKLYNLAAVLIPTILHGFYDFCLSLDSGWLILIYLVFVITSYIVGFKLQKKSAAEDVRIYDWTSIGDEDW